MCNCAWRADLVSSCLDNRGRWWSWWHRAVHWWWMPGWGVLCVMLDNRRRRWARLWSGCGNRATPSYLSDAFSSPLVGRLVEPVLCQDIAATLLSLNWWNAHNILSAPKFHPDPGTNQLRSLYKFNENRPWLVQFSRRRPKDNSQDLRPIFGQINPFLKIWTSSIWTHSAYKVCSRTCQARDPSYEEKTELAVSNSPDFNWPEVQPADMASSAQTDWCGFCGQLCRLLGSCKLVHLSRQTQSLKLTVNVC